MKLVSDVKKAVALLRERGPVALGRSAVDVLMWRYYPPRRRFAEALKRQRAIDEAWDKSHHVETTVELPLTEAGIDQKNAVLGNGIYRGVWVELFQEGMAAVDKPLQGYTFIDFGSGKGRALVMASDFPFARILGVEYSPTLHEIALNNLRVFKNDKQQCHALEAVLGDATSYPLPDAPLVCFFFNPFQTELLGQVFARIAAHARSSGQSVFIVYTNPRSVDEHKPAFAALQSARSVHRSRCCAVLEFAPR